MAENPGPSDYNPQELRYKRPDPSQGASDPVRSNSVAILTQSAPSIPPHRDSKAFNATGRPGDTIGPSHYNQETHKAMKTPIGHVGSCPDFHSSETERSFIPKPGSIDYTLPSPANPGPGTYNIRRRLAKGTSQPFLSATPQLSTAQPFVSKAGSPALTPGPGGYELENFSDPPPPSAGGPKAFSGLASSTAREGFWREAFEQPYTDPYNMVKVPGPGHYFSPSVVNKAQRARTASGRCLQDFQKFHGVHTPAQVKALKDSDAAPTTGFSVSSDRPCMKEIKANDPAGPGTYDRDYSLGQSITAGLREQVKLGSTGAFGGSKMGDRFAGPKLFKGKPDMPPPDQYTIGEVGERSDAAGGSFRSTVPQLPPDYTVDNIPKPGPGEYEKKGMGELVVMKAPPPVKPNKRTSGKQRGAFRRGRKDHLSFGSCQSRFDFGKELAPSALPGPGDYEPAGRRRKVGGAAKSTTDRKLEPPTQLELENDLAATRGPGCYEVQDGLARRTFNVSNEKVSVMLIRQAQSRDPKLALTAPAGFGSGFGSTQSSLIVGS